MNNLFDIAPVVSQKSNEWYTPAKYVEAARAVMGSIDLDPASCEMANRTVKATRYYSLEDDGLSKEWYGNVWLNPPYSSIGMLGRTGNSAGPMQYFISKLINHYHEGNITQAIVTATTDTDASWFQPFWDFPICFATHRVMFHRSDGTKEKQFFGTIFVYLGPNEAAFIERFSPFGRIAKAIDTPKAKVAPLSLWEVSV